MRALAKESGETRVETPVEAPGPAAGARTPVPAAPSAAANDAAPEPTPARESDDAAGGDALPSGARRDEARLLVQSPAKLFFYWSFARDYGSALRAALGEAAAGYRWAVRLVEPGGEWEGEPTAAADGESSFWFDALPGRAYRAEVGFHAAGRPFVRVLSSNQIETPAAGVSAESDAAPEFEIGERDFARLLEGSGFTRAARRASSEDLAARGGLLGESGLPSASWRGTSPARRADNY